MSELEDSFLQQIACRPHDWLPRLIFADWLEEQGDLRSELIRLSHELTHPGCDQRPAKEVRLRELASAGVLWPTPEPANSLNLSLVLIPPGEFRMGSPPHEPDRDCDETQVEVILTRGFWLGRSQVTQAEFLALMGENPSYFHSAELKRDSGRHPVEQVSWEDAMSFCRNLTARERAAGRLLSGWEYTLPAEAQWEYACRAGTTTATAFGDDLSSTQANFMGTYPYHSAPEGGYLARTQAAGSYRANAWNLYDMHGNVWEWCRDWYAARLPGGTDPEVRNGVMNRVIRGGSWVNRGWYCRSACRNRYTPGERDNTLGFRVALVQTR